MATYKTAGIYVQELTSGSQPTQGVGTSNMGIVGPVMRGLTGQAFFVGSWQEYLSACAFGVEESGVYTYGGTAFQTPIGIRNYFNVANGGGVWIVRSVGATAATATATLNTTGWTVSANSEGAWGNQIVVLVANNAVNTANVDIQIWRVDTTGASSLLESGTQFQNLDPNPADASTAVNYVVNAINNVSNYVTLTCSTTASLGVGSVKLAGGIDDAAGAAVWDSTLLNQFDVIQDVLTVVIPDYEMDGSDNVETSNVADLQSYCETNEFRIGVVGMYTHGATGYANDRSSYLAYYFPWMYVMQPITKQKTVVSCAPLVAGRYAATDNRTNVGKSPAGIIDGALGGTVVDSVELVTPSITDQMYPLNINPIINKRNAGYVVWGARLSSNDPTWLYVNKRRLFMFVEMSVSNSLTWVNFENNNSSTRARVRSQVDAFLYNLSNQGYFPGSTPSQNYFVVCDSSNNSQSSIDAGFLNVDIGIAVNKPAEFVVLRFSEKTAG